MDQQSWNVLNAAIAALAAIAGVIAAWAAIKVYRKQIEGEVPTVSASLEGSQLLIRVENITGTEWTVDRLLIPKGVRGNLEDRLSKRDGYGGLEPMTDAERAALLLTGEIPIGWEVHRSGTSSAAYIGGRADLARIRIHLASSVRRISMRLILLSSEARQRRIAIDITRHVPASAMIAKD